MLFSVKLDKEIYPPWKENYINYDKLKKLLKENVYYYSTSNSSQENKEWTEQNESAFVAALNLELEKVYSFQAAEYKRIDDSISDLQSHDFSIANDQNTYDPKTFQAKLEEYLSLAKELDHFARVNFTGFVKIVKKHDRLHPDYCVKPLLNVRLHELAFHSEDYSPLLYKISSLYNSLREDNKLSTSYQLNSLTSIDSSATNSNSKYSFQGKDLKFWIHPDNLMNVKAKILKHLPVLIYGDNNNDCDISESDNTVTSLYFDNSNFDLYNSKLAKDFNSPTLRLRWNGKLIEKPDIFLEKKFFNHDSNNTIDENFSSSFVTNTSSPPLTSFKLKEKYINSFVIDKDPSIIKKILNNMNKKNDKLTLEYLTNLQYFIIENNLEPTLRCIYNRTAFQMPNDPRIRIVIDSEILFVREDAFDKLRPIRDPFKWHRADIDSNIEDPYSLLRKGEYMKFPYSVMEINIKDPDYAAILNLNNNLSAEAKRPRKWLRDLTSNTKLVKEVPNFSKYIQGIASLHIEDEKLSSLPFWLPELEKDITKENADAHEEELSKLLHNKSNGAMFSGGMMLGRKEMMQKLMNKPFSVDDMEEYDSSDNEDEYFANDADPDDDDLDDEELLIPPPPPQKAVITNEYYFNNSSTSSEQYMPQSTLLDVESEEEDEDVILPPGVQKPIEYLKNKGPLKIEAKVWLANERTFIRWLHTTVLLFVLANTFGYSSKYSSFPQLTSISSSFYSLICVFSLAWGYYIFRKRDVLIRRRGDDHLDFKFGPIVFGFCLIFVLFINFSYGLDKALNGDHANVELMMSVAKFKSSIEDGKGGFSGFFLRNIAKAFGSDF